MTAKILIVEARFYEDISEELYKGASRVVEAAGARVERIAVPGALEIPAAIRLALASYDGFVALGCVLRGETYHFEVVANESARGLQDLALQHSAAIGNGILTCDTWEQAMARARADGEEDKGGAAATACLAMVALKHRFAGLR